MQTNARPISQLYWAVSRAKYDKISTCETGKEIYDKLKVTYKRSSKVKEDWISSLVNKYELFKMEDDENVKTTFHDLAKF